MRLHSAFSLDRPPVEHRTLGVREGIRLRLPLPPPAHVLFVEVPGLGRAPSHVQARWKREASAAMAQAPRRFLGGPVRIAITFADKGRNDLETRAKAIIDFLVLKNVIEDDSRRIVRELVLGWGPSEGCEVAIDPLESGTKSAAPSVSTLRVDPPPPCLRHGGGKTTRSLSSPVRSMGEGDHFRAAEMVEGADERDSIPEAP